MSCCACECGEGREADSFVMRETPPVQPLQFVVAGRSIQHPEKAALKSTNADAFAADQNVGPRVSGLTPLGLYVCRQSWSFLGVRFSIV